MDRPASTTTTQLDHRLHHPSAHSPAMNYFQHPPAAPPTSESYRDSPQQDHVSAASHAPLLPPIHHFDGQQMMHAQPQYAAAANMNAHIPPPSAHHQHYPPPYPTHQQQQYANGLPTAPMPSNVGVNGQNGGLMRYPLPPQAGLHMGNARKKDIKRRTKTGCLTCRKRRIKCDEAHPACRNCQKSKRECLGYDPIFKQQPGPALIQPAPAANARLKSESPSQPSPHAYRHPQPYPSAPASFAPGRDSPHGVDGRVEYVDPALGGGEQSLTMASNSFSTTLLPERKVRYMDIEQLFSINDVQPQFQHREAPPTNSNTPVQEVEDFYGYHFAPGLDKLLETTWYVDRGAAQLRRVPALLDFTMQVMEQMKARSDDIPSMQNVQSLEARLVWQFAVLPRLASSEGVNGAASDPLTTELLLRVDTLEHLLLGTFLPPQRIPPPPSSEIQPDHLKFHQQKFWHELGRFTSIRDDTADPNSTHMINDALLGMRGILGMLENRDVLYSLAIARHLGGRLLEFHHPRPVVPQSQDPNDEVRKLEVAQQFVSEEDRKGTTQVIQRICGMAMRAWILQKQQ